MRLVGVVAAVLAVSALLMVSAGPARAATITLDSCSHTGFDVLALWSAILTANNESTNPGLDTIRLAPNCVYNIGGPFTGTSYALPPITSSIEIVGRGATLHVPQLAEFIGLFDVRSVAGLVISDVKLTNLTGRSAGSYFANAGDVLIKDVTLDGNFDTIGGPAIVNGSGAHFTLLDSEVTRILHGDVASRGAAIHNQGDLYVIASDLVDNNAFCVPQALPPIANGSVSNNGHLELIDSYLRVARNCTGSPDPLWAAGIYNQGELIIRGSAIQGHRHTRSGAALYNSATGSVDVQATTFSSNRAGGAVYNDGNADFLNTVFVSNAAAGGGGGLKNAGSAQVSYSTLTTNGGDVANTAGSLSLTASIVQACSGTISDGGSNLKASPTSGCPGSVGDAKLQLWPFASVKGAVFALGPGSAAIDAATVSCPATDQRGLARPGGGACDIGAYENHPPAAPTNLVLSGVSNPGNSEQIGLDWANATDPDFDSLTYRLYGKDANDSYENLLSSGSASTASLTLAEGTYGFRVDAFDGNHASASSATLNGIVVDLTPPSSPTATPDRSPDYTDPGTSTGWWKDTVTVTFSGSTDPRLLDGSAGSGVASTTSAQTYNTSGEHTATGTSTDNAGNTSTSTSLTVHVDTDDPEIAFASCPADVIYKSNTVLGWSANDDESGLATGASGTVPLETATLGSKTATAMATDNVGHQETATCNYRVIFDFTGFLRPVLNPPADNPWVAGDNVLISFSLAGDQGLGILAPGYPQSAPITCGTTPPLETGDPTTSVRGLTYTRGTNSYAYIWRTSPSWAGTCRQLIVKLIDGTYHRANFTFR